MPIKVITIDFWNTLFDSSHGDERNQIRQKSILQEIAKYNISISHEQFSEALAASWEHFNSIWKNDSRTPEPRESVEYFFNYLNLPADAESIDNVTKCFAESILDYPPKLIDGVKESLELLSKSYLLAIVSDTGFSPGEILKRLLIREGIGGYFKSYSFSDETGVSKPHPKAFLTALEPLGCKPENALHIGDIEFTDIVGAKKLGMKAIRFSGDPTAFLNLENAKVTLADAEAFTWQEITEKIKMLDK